MADKVNDALERMIPELEDLEATGIFSAVSSALPALPFCGRVRRGMIAEVGERGKRPQC